MALEKYSLEETLGSGAYAKVKLAKCRDTSEKEAAIPVYYIRLVVTRDFKFRWR